MQNILSKSSTLRTAIAQSEVVVSDQRTIDAVLQKTVPKGDVLEAARIAGLFGVKRTSDLIPDCHPLPIEHTEVRYKVEGLSILVEVEVSTIYKTGVEVEAMHGASIVALTIYDMLKPIDKSIEIRTIKLRHKTGGKTSQSGLKFPNLSAGVLVISDSVSNGSSKDGSGILIEEDMRKYFGGEVHTETVSDDAENIRAALDRLISKGSAIILSTGGTGLGPRDKTPETISQILETTIPGIMEAIRSYGQERMPFAMLSRGVAGIYRGTIVITLPGSPSGVRDSLCVLFPSILHYFQVRDGQKH